MRQMSVAFTEAAVRSRTKTVTRRLGWAFLTPGVQLELVRKGMGRKPGEPIVPVAHVEVISVSREPLWRVYNAGEVALEGFPGMSPAEFIERFFIPQGVDAGDEVTRIQWRYLEVVNGRCPCGGRVVPETQRGVVHLICSGCSVCSCCDVAPAMLERDLAPP